MAGNENSGRKTSEYETVKNAVVNKCWDIIEGYLKNNPNLRKRFTQQIVLEIAKKSMPTNVNLNGNLFIKKLEDDIKNLADEDEEQDETISPETL